MIDTMEPEVRKVRQPQVLEGQWEEILARHGAQLAGQKVKVYVQQDEAEATAQAFPPNEQALSMLRDLVRLQEGMKETAGSETDPLQSRACRSRTST